MKKPGFDIDLLQAFVAVAETGSFTLAGRRLHLSQSAISLKIKRLEASMDHPLLERTPPIRPTRVGERFLATALRLLEAHEDAFEKFARMATVERIVIGASETYAASFLPVALKMFRAEHPEVEVVIRCGHSWDLLQAQADDGIDIVLATRHPRYEGVTLKSERLVWVGRTNPTVTGHDEISLAVFPEGCLFRTAMTNALSAAGRSWTFAYTCTHYDGLMTALSDEGVVTAITEGAVPDDCQILGAGDELPRLPSMDVVLYESPQASPAARRLTYLIQATCGRGRNGSTPGPEVRAVSSTHSI